MRGVVAGGEAASNNARSFTSPLGSLYDLYDPCTMLYLLCQILICVTIAEVAGVSILRNQQK
jgi:hypothetical protein